MINEPFRKLFTAPGHVQISGTTLAGFHDLCWNWNIFCPGFYLSRTPAFMRLLDSTLSYLVAAGMDMAIVDAVDIYIEMVCMVIVIALALWECLYHTSAL